MVGVTPTQMTDGERCSLGSLWGVSWRELLAGICGHDPNAPYVSVVGWVPGKAALR